MFTSHALDVSSPDHLFFFLIRADTQLFYSVPDHEYEVRTDLRKERIFTIDPEGAKDLDDALSIKLNDDGTYDVGIHITDVSFHVKPNTALDRDARKRATSVYLVQRVVPMLPPALSEKLCSLAPGEERLAFSVVLTLTKEAKIIKKWFGKTVIKSAAKLSYAIVQGVLDGEPLGDVCVAPEHEVAIENDIKLLYDLAKVLRTRRFQNGALRLETPRLSFKLNDQGLPVDCSQVVNSEANDIVEEVWSSAVGVDSQMTISPVYAAYQHCSCAANCRRAS